MAIKPFTENSLFEQDKSDKFFATGSSPNFGSESKSFSTPLWNKEQIRFSFPVKNAIKMLENESSIYYFNFDQNQWKIPPNSLPDHVEKFNKISYRTIGSGFPPGGTVGSSQIEDQIGFDCFGSPVATGNLEKRRAFPAGTIGPFNSLGNYEDLAYKQDKQMKYLTMNYPNSVQRNFNYDASSSEIFTFAANDTNLPFLLEKAVVELPLCFGPRWFNDYTTTSIAYAPEDAYQYDGTWPAELYALARILVDEGGPGITLSLFSQKKYGNSNIRDLICSTLISPYSDLNLDNFSSWPYLEKQSLDGFLYYLTTPTLTRTSGSTAIEAVYPNLGTTPNEYFTGSLQVKLTPSIANGIKLSSAIMSLGSMSPVDSSGPAKARQDYKKLVTKEFLVPETMFVTSVDTFGRGMTGFDPSGGSIFGSEYVTSQNKIFAGGEVRNPYYVKELADDPGLLEFYASLFEMNYSNFQSSCAAATPQQSSIVPAICSINLGDKRESPYLINPGEKLILSISKHRPALAQYGVNVTLTDDYTIGEGQNISGYTENFNAILPIADGGHDVTLNTGSINITFYGSYVRENKEYVP